MFTTSYHFMGQASHITGAQPCCPGATPQFSLYQICLTLVILCMYWCSTKVGITLQLQLLHGAWQVIGSFFFTHSQVVQLCSARWNIHYTIWHEYV